ncbi:gala protein [Streptomyces sp. fd1-xmd]|uniref:gala protein n=1 Tax=Streptomyces sp. fd1-xmd TaxID=1812480 RepID=UPI000990739A|nr:gala protein [Streptomyces sp. fd1-xmd]AQT76222.1 gala protein [Streptomyces sp. fd1-xmd]
MTQPTPVRCPAIEHPDLPPADPAGLDPLLARLAADRPVETDETFPLGTLRADGRVDLCKQGLGPAGAARLLPAAAASPHATHLLLGTNAIADTGARTLAEALTADGHGLHTLYLGCNRIGPDGLGALAGALTADTTVRALWLKRNPLHGEGARILAALLRRNTALRTLDLVNTGIGADGVRLLLDALLEREQPLERLFLGGNGLGPDAAPLLADLIRVAGVRELYVPANHLGDEGAAALAAAAAHSARPVRLGLGGNGIGPAGAHALAASLGGIETLDLGRTLSERSLGAPGNDPGDEGAYALAAALPGSPLRRLELRHTGLTGRGAKSLLAAVRDDSRLEYVGLGPGLPRRVKRSFTERLRPARAAHPDVRAIGSVYR